MILLWPFKFGFENARKKYKELKNKLFFNDLFSIAFEGYFIILLVSFLNLQAP